MDPLSIAGLGLGAVSLAAQAFMGSMQAITLILKAQSLKPEFRYLTIRLQLEKQRLWNWSQVSGLLEFAVADDACGGRERLDTGLAPGLNRHLGLEVMLLVKEVVVGFVRVTGRYEGFLDGAGDEAEDVEEVVRRVPDVKAEVARRLVSSVRVAQGLPKRLRWAVWDHEKFTAMVDRLKELNDCLIDLVDHSVRMRVFRMTEETNIHLLGLCNKVEDLGQLILALKEKKEAVGKPNETARFRMGSDAELLDLTRFKALNEVIEHGALHSSIAEELDLQLPGERMKDSEIDGADVQLVEAGSKPSGSFEGLRCEALYRGQRVWIEWKEYQPIDRNSMDPDPNILLRVQKLTTLLRKDIKPAVFRAPHCLGYYIDRSLYVQSRKGQQNRVESQNIFSNDHEPKPCHFGFVFAKPLDIDPSIAPISLFSLLNKPPKPSLTSRLALSQALVNCLRYLHSVNWLHKGLRSHNIIFFPASAGTVDYTKPYLTGFDYARPSRTDEMTEAPPANPEFDIYKHPRAQPSAARDGYRKSFDIYTIGIVLMEITAWKSLSEILGMPDPRSVSVVVALRVRRRLLTERAFLENVDAAAGEKVGGAVRCCLEGGMALGVGEVEDEGEESVAAKVGRAFYEKVVRELEEVRC